LHRRCDAFIAIAVGITKRIHLKTETLFQMITRARDFLLELLVRDQRQDRM
jgi:hypothetical protein